MITTAPGEPLAAGAEGDGPAPATLPGLLLAHAEARPAAVALRKKDLGRWREYRWEEYARRSARVGLGLLEIGVGPGDRVAVHSENRPSWLFADLGIQGIGAVTVGIYPTSPPSEVEYLLGHSGSVVLFAEDEEQLDKALAVRARLPELRTIVVIDPRGVKQLDDPMIVTFAELEALGERRQLGEYADRVAALDPSNMAMIVYTSGTTGPPKGAMLSHANLLGAGAALRHVFGTRPDDEVLSYLPLCHVAERLGSAVNALAVGYVVNFGEGGESFPNDLYEVQPTVFLGVPRVWEKMMAAIQIRMADASPLKRLTYRVSLGLGRRLARRRMAGRLGLRGRVGAAVATVLIQRPLRDKLGLGRVRVAISGAAPIAPQVL